MKPMIRIRGKHVNQNQINGYEQPTYRERQEPVYQPGRDIRMLDHYETIREMVLPVTVNGEVIALIGKEAEQAFEDLNS